MKVAFGRLPQRCQPSQVRLTLDANDDGQPGISRLYPFRGRTRRIRLTRPSYLVATPDVVAASGLTRQGFSGESATVRITP